MKQSLNGKWRLFNSRYDISANVPGSLCGSLLDEGLIDDPYYRDNEYKTLPIFDEGVTYEREFDLDEELLGADKVLLRFYGIDTLSGVSLNGSPIFTTNNMHREYTCDITELVHAHGNTLTVKIASPTKYIAEKNAETPIWGVASTMAGYPHIRKAHYMFGWDWGPMLPDMGIWRDVELIGVRGGLIDNVYIRQNHERISEDIIELDIDVETSFAVPDGLYIKAELTAPDGCQVMAGNNIGGKKTLHMIVAHAKLWFPRGYGEQPLYGLSLRLVNENGETLDEREMKIGLRTVSVSRGKLTKADGSDNGEEFAFTVNGLKIFAMGANYIPEDQILPRRSAQLTERLLNACCDANYNMIRVWGGGIYPDDWFYELCDQMGLLVWQDCMFACSAYKADEEFCDTVRAEIADNAKRIRNHPSLAMWCGNNEVESMWEGWGLPEDQHRYKEDYLRLFEQVIPEVLKEYDPGTFYWCSSPSSGGGFDGSSDEHRGDQHYWAVWHSLKPFEDYYNHIFRFCSEFGFESVPSIKTVKSFSEPHDLNLCAPVMEAHQKCDQGTEKIMYYLAQMSHYPYDFEGLIYATQMVQADAIRINVENMRRSRGVCMGSLYWQVNDSNPVISWASLDYFHRRKALHYIAKKFYAPVLLSADDHNPERIRLNVSSERQEEFIAEISWRSRKNTGEIIVQGSKTVTVKPLSAEYFLTLTPDETGISSSDKKSSYIEFSLIENGETLSANTCMPVRPKQFKFVDPQLMFFVKDCGERFEITINSEAFAKGVWLDLKTADCVFSDNFFDLHGNSRTIAVDKSSVSANLTETEFARALTVFSYYEMLGLE